jgi:hypothetical protein
MLVQLTSDYFWITVRSCFFIICVTTSVLWVASLKQKIDSFKSNNIGPIDEASFTLSSKKEKQLRDLVLYLLINLN